MHFPQRVLFWTAVIGFGVVASFFGRQIADGIYEDATHFRHSGVIALFVSIVVTPFVWLLMTKRPDVDFATLPTPVSIYLYVFLTVCCVVVLRFMLMRSGVEEDEEAEEVEVAEADWKAVETGRPRLANRLGDMADAKIVRLTVRDHFVEVTTTRGTVILRMRFADAVNEMEPVPGICTHRSHWVAFDMVAGESRDSTGKPLLIMVNGDIVPVSRTYKKGLDAAGYFAAKSA